MNVDRYMVNLFFEIRRNLPRQQQQGMRLSAPDLGEKFVTLYNTSDDENIQLLVEIFLERAGEDWIKKIRKSKNRIRGVKATKEKLKTKDKEETSPTKENPRKKSNYYRGVQISWAVLTRHRRAQALCGRMYGKAKSAWYFVLT